MRLNENETVYENLKSFQLFANKPGSLPRGALCTQACLAIDRTCGIDNKRKTGGYQFPFLQKSSKPVVIKERRRHRDRFRFVRIPFTREREGEARTAKHRWKTRLAWVSRRDRKASVIFDTRDRVSGVAGATLTWHVGRYQVLPRRRVDADPRRMRGLPTTPRRSPPPARRTFAPHHSSLRDLPPSPRPLFCRTGKRHRGALPFPRHLSPRTCVPPSFAPAPPFPEAAPTPSTCYQQVRVAYRAT